MRGEKSRRGEKRKLVKGNGTVFTMSEEVLLILPQI
jgi:hypothetical protein